MTNTPRAAPPGWRGEHASEAIPPTDWRAFIVAETPKLAHMNADEREAWLDNGGADAINAFEEAAPDAFWQWYPRHFRKDALDRARERGRKLPKTAKRKGRERRLWWTFSPVPTAIIDDAELSGNAKALAATIARKINLGPWNTDLHVDLTLDELGRLSGVGSRWSVRRALDELTKKDSDPPEPPYVVVESLNRGGCRIRFGAGCG